MSVYTPSEEIRLKIRALFEPRHGRRLRESEVLEIALNLAGFAEVAIEAALDKKVKNKRVLGKARSGRMAK